MKILSKTLSYLFVYFILGTGTTFANITDNQTDQLSPVFPNSKLPFRVVIQKTNLELPKGLHSGMVGVYNGLWIFIAGRTNGLHGFGADPFPPGSQNTDIYVINPTKGSYSSRSLADPSSGLTQQQIDSLAVTSPQGYQDGNTLYMTGGYGIDTGTGTYTTKPILTAINLPGIVKWVLYPNNKSYSVVKNIKQITSSTFQVAGGEMFRVGSLTQLVFGQNFTGVYTSGSNGEYTQQVRIFQIMNKNGNLSVKFNYSKPFYPDANYRRRDLNVMPAILSNNNAIQYGSIAYAGVFTNTAGGGVWTVPVVIDMTGKPTMADPNSPATFKQALNQYVCASAGLYSRKNRSMYNIFFGGMTYGYYSGTTFQTDAEIPFTNQVTTVKMDKNGNFTQYLMDSRYPTLYSATINPGNPLLFGAGAYFIPNNTLPHFANGVISLDNLNRTAVIGYIVGGIASTLPNTNVDADSFGSTYVFKVTLVLTK